METATASQPACERAIWSLCLVGYWSLLRCYHQQFRFLGLQLASLRFCNGVVAALHFSSSITVSSLLFPFLLPFFLPLFPRFPFLPSSPSSSSSSATATTTAALLTRPMKFLELQWKLPWILTLLSQGKPQQPPNQIRRGRQGWRRWEEDVDDDDVCDEEEEEWARGTSLNVRYYCIKFSVV